MTASVKLRDRRGAPKGRAFAGHLRMFSVTSLVVCLAAVCVPTLAQADVQVNFNPMANCNWQIGSQRTVIQGPVSVYGLNQYNQPAKWTGTSDGFSAITRGWWFHGWVKVYWRAAADGRLYLTTAYVPTVHRVVRGDPYTVVLGCAGVVGGDYPQNHKFDNLGGKVYQLLSPSLAKDPVTNAYLPRTYTFGYWDGHYVYMLDSMHGIDINTGQPVVAQSRDHRAVLGGAFKFGTTCYKGTEGLWWAPWARAVIVSWCGVAGAGAGQAGYLG